ncbi:MAG TPA: lysine--tRNA ligase, partial [Nitrospiraceae bacterium]|nr:lysine--tRNA ligase [Nitrospiraceae bacterium]
MEELNEQQQQRLEKLKALQDRGLRPFGTRFTTTDTLEKILHSYTSSTKDELEGNTISCAVAGRIVAMRRFGKAAFAALQEEGYRLQVYLKKDLLGDQSYELSQSFDLGDWIGVEGRLFRTKTDELTVEVHTLTFLTKGLRPLPEKWHGLTDIETRYRQRYVDLIANPSVHEVFRTRSRIIN